MYGIKFAESYTERVDLMIGNSLIYVEKTYNSLPDLSHLVLSIYVGCEIFFSKSLRFIHKETRPFRNLKQRYYKGTNIFKRNTFKQITLNLGFKKYLMKSLHNRKKG